MDILDIDEALKDDSFIFLEDKTHDDVSNILQQWKSNCVQEQQNQLHQQQQPEQAYKLNSRTFTRPKRKSAQNLESQFSNTSQFIPQLCNGSPVLNVEIGGLVTTMQKSYLQDTSPPSSICSSMDVSVDRMNNSLITSADFININFLQSTNGIDFNDTFNPDFDLANKVTNDGYSLNDMIRDRKALESLTMSGDGTLIKDCNIAQIDDISLALSKTASGCSTMDNSTESMDANNRTVQLANNQNVTRETNAEPGIMQKTIILTNEMISDTTFNLIENSMYDSALNTKQEQQLGNSKINQTFKKPTPFDETIFLSRKDNISFDCQDHTPDKHSETPENISLNSIPSKFYESTPQAPNVRKSRQQYTPTIKNCDDVNISPIIPINGLVNATRVLNETFDSNEKTEKCKLISDSFSGVLPNLEAIEMIEDIKNPNEALGGSLNKIHERYNAGSAMQNVMDLAQAEAELLAGNDDEEEFEHMLDEFSRVELNAEQLKMKKSLDSIKKRFTYSFTENNGRELSSEAKDMREIMKNSAELLDNEKDVLEESNITNNLNKTRDFMNESNINFSKTFYGNGRDMKESMADSREYMKQLRDSSSNNITLSALTTSGTSSGERLLKRSRLYDDINLSSLSMQSKSHASSFTILKQEKGDENEIQKTETQADIRKEKTDGFVNGKPVEEVLPELKNESPESEKKSHRLAEKRERDRDRFKTIKIVKHRPSDSDDDGRRLNVPCIDDDIDVMNDLNTANNLTEVPQRLSRRDHISPSSDPVVINCNIPDLDDENTKAKHTNYLTYKKPKEKIVKPNHPEVALSSRNSNATSGSKTKTRLDQRSLSRPRYISGLQKFNVVSKATSAGDLEKTSELTVCKQLNLTANSGLNASKQNATTFNTNGTQSTMGNTGNVKELKSPMGIKAKSFHNLSSNFGYSSGSTAQKTCSSSVKSKINNSSILTEKQTKVNSIRTNQSNNSNRTSNVSIEQLQKTEETVFKVPKLVSGIRAPSATSGAKRAGLVRPSSGYYSLNVTATAKNASTTADFDVDSGRQSPTDSMSSTSSRSSVGSGLKPLNTIILSSAIDSELPSTLIKINTGSTGIPKPSGLRPPTNIKRSGLPRPASIVKR